MRIGRPIAIAIVELKGTSRLLNYLIRVQLNNTVIFEFALREPVNFGFVHQARSNQ